MSVPLFNLAPNLTVSRLCLGLSMTILFCRHHGSAKLEASNSLLVLSSGTMTFGEHNSLPQSFRLLDQAFEAGINFFDSAEMYPVPQRAETPGKNEEYFGQWVRKRNIYRYRVVISTKVTRPSGQMSWIRDGPKCLDANNITEAIDGRLVPYDVAVSVTLIALEMTLDWSLFEIVFALIVTFYATMLCRVSLLLVARGLSFQFLAILAC
ncbi:protein tas-like [Hibiscus syriacus]|uniref:protein tas-like n=1 Tax=Hibiscus syriacus TaxID=106335 RepID=UPI0019232BFE|nr:protein tas-like [Hibiscus syriacus]